MAIYKLINGKLVDVNDLPQEEKKDKHFNSSINLTPGIKWGNRGYQKKYISTDERGRRKVYSETKNTGE
jgi:hypothetical protein